RYLTGNYPPLSLHAIQGSHRANEVRQLGQDRAQLGRTLSINRGLLGCRDSLCCLPSCSTSLRTSSVEEWSEWGERHRWSCREGSSGERAGRRTNQSLNIVPCRSSPSRLRSAQRGRLFMATFQLKHHSLNVPVVLVPTEESQTLLRIAPLQNLDGFLTSTP